MTWTPTWTAPSSWAASGLSRPPTCPATTAASPSSPTRTATRSGCGAEPARPLVRLLGQDGAQRVEDRRVLDRGRYRLVLAVGYAPHGLAQDLAGPGLGQAGDHVHPAERRDRADPVPDQLHQLRGQHTGLGADARLEHHEPARYLALELVVHPDDRALGHRRMAGQHLLHLPGGQPVSGHVDHVVDAAHDVYVAVLVAEPAVARGVEARVA